MCVRVCVFILSCVIVFEYVCARVGACVRSCVSVCS